LSLIDLLATAYRLEELAYSMTLSARARRHDGTLKDQMMDAWEEQIKSPNPSAMLSKLKYLSGPGPVGSWPNPGDMSAMNPMQFSMQFMEQWQKVCSEAMAFWTKAASSQWPRTGT
jgi:hypothetical protein